MSQEEKRTQVMVIKTVSFCQARHKKINIFFKNEARIASTPLGNSLVQVIQVTVDSILTNYRILVCYKLWEHHLDCKRENQLKGCFIRCLPGANQALIADPSAITIQGRAVKFPTLPVSLEEP